MAERRSSRRALRFASGELELLQVLWRDGPATIAQVHEGLGRAAAYTTVQTRLDRLVAKGVASKSAERPAKYTASVTQDEVSRGHLGILIERVSRGSIVPLIAQLVSETSLSTEEMQEVRRLIDQAERKMKGCDS